MAFEIKTNTDTTINIFDGLNCYGVPRMVIRFPKGGSLITLASSRDSRILLEVEKINIPGLIEALQEVIKIEGRSH